jgi:DNA-binding NarL/FixJ family response regulator
MLKSRSITSPAFSLLSNEELTVTRVFLTSDDSNYCETLRDTFQAQHDFVVCGEGRNDIVAVLKDVVKLLPDLAVVEVQSEPIPEEDMEIAKALKIIMPEVPLFLVMERDGVQVEKEVLSHGVDAVFEKDQVSTSLVENARAVCREL